MTRQPLTAVEIERAAEQIRQEKETFNQQRDHAERWFKLRLTMGYTSVVLLTGIMCISSFVLLRPIQFPSFVLESAGGALFVDVLGLLIGVWKIALKSELAGTLAPVTKSGMLVPSREQVAVGGLIVERQEIEAQSVFGSESASPEA
jgi:hypothetical protein